SLLDEPVRGEIEACRQLHGVTLDLNVHREAGLARLLTQAVEVLKARLRRQSRGLLGPPEDADEAAHLRQCLPPCLLDDEQRLSLPLLIGFEEPPHARSLDRHDADAV